MRRAIDEKFLLCAEKKNIFVETVRYVTRAGILYLQSDKSTVKSTSRNTSIRILG